MGFIEAPPKPPGDLVLDFTEVVLRAPADSSQLVVYEKRLAAGPTPLSGPGLRVRLDVKGNDFRNPSVFQATYKVFWRSTVTPARPSIPSPPRPMIGPTGLRQRRDATLLIEPTTGRQSQPLSSLHPVASESGSQILFSTVRTPGQRPPGESVFPLSTPTIYISSRWTQLGEARQQTTFLHAPGSAAPYVAINQAFEPEQLPDGSWQSWSEFRVAGTAIETNHMIGMWTAEVVLDDRRTTPPAQFTLRPVIRQEESLQPLDVGSASLLIEPTRGKRSTTILPVSSLRPLGGESVTVAVPERTSDLIFTIARTPGQRPAGETVFPLSTPAVFISARWTQLGNARQQATVLYAPGATTPWTVLDQSFEPEPLPDGNWQTWSEFRLAEENRVAGVWTAQVVLDDGRSTAPAHFTLV